MSEILRRLLRTTALRSLRTRLMAVITPIVLIGVGGVYSLSGRLDGGAGWLVALMILGLVVTGVYAAVTALVRPVDVLGRIAKDLAAGDFSQRAAPSDTDLGRLGRYMNVIVDRHKVALGQVETSNVQLRTILESLPVEIALFDAQRRYLYRRPGEQAKAAPPNIAIGMTAPELCLLMHADVANGEEIERAVTTCMETGESVHLDLTEAGPGSAPRTVAWVLTPVVDPGDSAAKVIGYGVDTTTWPSLGARRVRGRSARTSVP